MRNTMAVAAMLALLGAQPAAAAGAAAISAQVKAAFLHWRAEEFTHGALMLPDEITACFAQLKAGPTETKAAYCIALDHFTVVNAGLTPGEALPDFFSDANVGDRFATAVVEATPESSRIAFQHQLETALAPYDKRLKTTGQ
jgi:hypothetical protein